MINIQLGVLRATFEQMFNATSRPATLSRQGGTPDNIRVALRQPKGRGETLTGDLSQETMEFLFSQANLAAAGVAYPPRYGDRVVVDSASYTLTESVLPLMAGDATIGWRAKVLG